jgi:23S rRNA (uracil1939-C5)-methyltransferase
MQPKTTKTAFMEYFSTSFIYSTSNIIAIFPYRRYIGLGLQSFSYPRNEIMEDGHFALQIESMAYGGNGVGRREDGKVVFIPRVIPGEKVVAVITKEHKSFIEAKVKELLETSPYRITPPCPHFFDCGGCDWQHIMYCEQIAFKQGILKAQILAKIPRTDLSFDNPEISSKEYGYRCHAVVQCVHNDGFDIGFYRKQSNTITPFDQCLILNERCQAVLNQIREMLRDHLIAGLDSIEIHAPMDEVLVRAFVKGALSKDDLDFFKKVYQTIALSGLSILSMDELWHEHVFGKRLCCYDITVHDRKVVLASSFGGFIQANMYMNQRLVEYVHDNTQGSKKLIDLYSGAGNFSIPLSFKTLEVLAVEQDQGLVKAGADLALRNGCRNIRFINEKASRTLKWLEKEGVSFDSVVLDPPREGARDIAHILPKMKMNKVVYISCNPSTLARDLAVLIQEGFRLKTMRFFDMFPQTFHIESVSVLER